MTPAMMAQYWQRMQQYFQQMQQNLAQQQQGGMGMGAMGGMNPMAMQQMMMQQQQAAGMNRNTGSPNPQNMMNGKEAETEMVLQEPDKQAPKQIDPPTQPKNKWPLSNKNTNNNSNAACNKAEVQVPLALLANSPGTTTTCTMTPATAVPAATDLEIFLLDLVVVEAAVQVVSGEMDVVGKEVVSLLLALQMPLRMRPQGRRTRGSRERITGVVAGMEVVEGSGIRLMGDGEARCTAKTWSRGAKWRDDEKA